MRGGDIFLICIVLVVGVAATGSHGANVSYDSRAITIDGQRKVLISGAIHYPRSTPEMWPSLIQKSKDGGLDTIETYVFWNIHEPARNQFDFKGRKDLVKFIKTVHEAGLYVFLRIGPYVCAEWNYGGFPLWLHSLPGVQLRTDNEPYKAEMQRFTTFIVNLMKENNLFASQGGPIILSQIENEYGNIQGPYGEAGKSYVKWAANMAISQNIGVPWVMCQQGDAPDTVINTCNGFYCDQFTPNSPKSPKMWTENWSGWFLGWGESVPYRPTEDLAYAVARFYQRGGTFTNYYMYHGGTNFGRTSGGPFITTSYDYDAPLDEYGLESQPKYGHLKDLHRAIRLCEKAMVATTPAYSTPATNVEVAEYKTDSGLCSAYIANTDGKNDATVNYNGNTYHIPAWSVSILPDCKNVVFNTAQINSLASIPTFNHIKAPNVQSYEGFESSSSSWSWYQEPIGISKDDAFAEPKLLEQINTTSDKSDYLWYSVSTSISGNEPFITNGSQTNLHVSSDGHVLYAFVNGKLAGSAKGNNSHVQVSLHQPITLIQGRNQIDLLSLTVGLQNYGAYFDKAPAGITKSVMLEGGNSSLDLSSQVWRYQIGLKGEELGLSTGGFAVIQSLKKHKGPTDWAQGTTLPKNQPLTWYKTQIDAPPGKDPVAIHFTGMGKGHAWINGQSIGRFWPTYNATNNGCSLCDYRGSYSAGKCRKGCGKPSQEYNHVPRSWLKPSGNTLVLLEEMGGDPTQLAFVTRQIGSLCSHVAETHPADLWHTNKKKGKKSKETKTTVPVVSLTCPSRNQVISSIRFASFGNPQGTCGSFSHGDCTSDKALSIVEKACTGKNSCNVGVSVDTFGDPCPGKTKSLAVEASCLN